MRNICRGLLAALVMLLLPVVAHAQASIAGSAKDPSGAVLPGVMVEASSAALIEKSRVAITDGAGQFRIVDLPPGIYDVTFTLSGFKTIRREGIVLEGTFAAQINGELQVGTLEESITVTGESPVVDVVNNRAQFVANRDILDAIPTPVRNTPLRALLLPGTAVVPFVLGQYTMSVNGSASADTVIAIDGMRVNNLCGSGQYSGFYMNDAAVEEVTFTTGAESAEMATGGLRINSIPKDGGNTFSGSFFAYGAGDSLQADNRSDAVKAANIALPSIAYTWQVNPSFGGPIVRNKLWFYATYKYEDNKTYVASSRFADGSPAFRQSMGNYTAVGRLTWQASSRDKIRFYVDRQFNGEFYNGFNTLPSTTPEASTDAFGKGWVTQLKWTQTTSNRLLLEAGLTSYNQPYEQNYRPEVGERDLASTEQTTGLLSFAAGSTIPPYTSETESYSAVAAASYITGSHAIKTGMTMQWGTNSRTFTSNAQINTLVTNAALLGAPASASNPVPCTRLPCPLGVLVTNGPATSRQKVNSDFGIYAQDSWTLNRLTLNIGGRYDHFNAEIPAQSLGAGVWVNARDFAAIENVPNWDDWSVRFAGAYDVFGNGKTALKANASKYIAAAAAGYAQNFNPGSYVTETRAWFDLDGNKSLFDAAGNVQKGEVFGGTSNFDQVRNRPDPDLARGYNWEYGVSVQHQLHAKLSMTVGYHRRNFYNLDVTDNLNLATTEWNEFVIGTPNDSRLELAGQPITMYSLNANKVGTPTDNLRTYSSINTTKYDGLEFSGNARFSKLLLFGGVNIERRATESCDERDNPNGYRFCDSIPPYRATYKLSGAYNMFWQLQLSGTFQAIPGSSVAANYSVTSTIAGRTVIGTTAGGTSISVNLVEPNTMFLDYRKQLDLRIARNFRVDRYRLQPFADVFNFFNSGTVLRVNQTYGANPATNPWLSPQAIQDGRYIRFGVQMSF